MPSRYSIPFRVWKDFVDECWRNRPDILARLRRMPPDRALALLKPLIPGADRRPGGPRVEMREATTFDMELVCRDGESLWPALDSEGLALGKRHVLFWVHDPVPAKLLKRVCALVRNDPRIKCYFTAADESRFQEYQDFFRLPFAPRFFSRLKRWDLIVCASHIADNNIDPRIPVIHLQHGIGLSKNFSGASYTYGKLPRQGVGRAPYMRIFEASHWTRDWAVSRYPELRDRLAVVGDLNADALRASARRRERIRREMGFGKGETVVVLMSTWGKGCLLERMGPGIIDEAQRLMRRGRYRFIVASHPILWQEEGGRFWPEYLLAQEDRGFRVIRPLEDWQPYLAAADVAISDHTSLAIQFALLRRPAIYIPIAEDALIPQSLGDRIYRASPKLSRPAELPSLIRSALKTGQDPAIRPVLSEICSYPGQAASRMRKELYAALRLAPRARA